MIFQHAEYATCGNIDRVINFLGRTFDRSPPSSFVSIDPARHEEGAERLFSLHGVVSVSMVGKGGAAN